MTAVLHHLVMIHVADGTPDESVDAMVAALRELPSLIPSIESYSVGRDAGLREGNAAVGITATFEGADGWREYVDHPDHQRVISEHIAPISTARQSVQFIL